MPPRTEPDDRICSQMGYDAYEFHDRSSSIVTVGSFDSVGTRRRRGKIEINPTVHKIMPRFAR